MSIPISFWTPSEDDSGLIPCKDDDINSEEVYLVLKNVDKLCGDHEHLQRFKRHATEDGSFYTTYYQTFGGGPEGGYFLCEFYHINGFDPIKEVYSVERTWGTPFKVERLDAYLDYDVNGDGTAGTLCIIPNNWFITS
jgi:hypothetical protein